jgi:hypothetical protein
VPIPSQESKWSSICVLGYRLFSVSSIFLLDFGTVPTVWYILCFILLLQLANATEEMADASNYNDIRLFKVNRHLSKTPLTEFSTRQVYEHWAIPTAGKTNFNIFVFGSN